MKYLSMLSLSLSILSGAGSALASEADGKIEPTFLYRDIATAVEKPSDLSTSLCHYMPLFGEGDREAAVPISVARFAKVVVDPHGACASVRYESEDQIYVVLQGSGSAQYAGDQIKLVKEDYIYLPSTISHALRNDSDLPLTVIVMGYRTAGFPVDPLPPHPLKANISDVPLSYVNNHPSSSHFRLLLGDRAQKRDKIDAGSVVTSLFLMEIDAGGTNFPHHHLKAEEIYLVLDGNGRQVAGSGDDGVAGFRKAKVGDAYYYRPNTTVGYYSGDVKSRILCVRSFLPSSLK